MTKLIEYNLEDVDATILAVRVALANEMAWDDLERMVKEEKKSGNPIAALIDKLYLERNGIKEAQRKHYRAVRGKSKLCYPGGEEVKCTVAPHTSPGGGVGSKVASEWAAWRWRVVRTAADVGPEVQRSAMISPSGAADDGIGLGFAFAMTRGAAIRGFIRE
ncbi:hypothetical protein KSP40_PGU000723 [Platanthera guangdongensis]|uniref:Uncharacterized protein n=1 Tax=Platanthera guangdongensis TaxID=2320717 RepID=A0ABR2MHR3_9ASPA